MSDITVRQAAPSELDDLTSLFDQYRQFQGQDSNLAAARQFLQARFDHHESIVFMALQGPVPVGFAQLYPSFSSASLARAFVLNDLFVHESARRKGVASALLRAIEGHAWSLGAVRVSLNVARDNQAGQALYEAQGWSQDAQFFMYHRFPNAG